jgi:ubiquitin C-terminal hydrolase
MNRIRKKPAYQELKDIKGEEISAAANRWWEYSMGTGNSVITDLFGGQIISEVFCGACENVSWTFDLFLDLSLPIPGRASSELE